MIKGRRERRRRRFISGEGFRKPMMSAYGPAEQSRHIIALNSYVNVCKSLFEYRDRLDVWLCVHDKCSVHSRYLNTGMSTSYSVLRAGSNIKSTPPPACLESELLHSAFLLHKLLDHSLFWNEFCVTMYITLWLRISGTDDKWILYSYSEYEGGYRQ